MSQNKQEKFYVVKVGRKPGIYKTWDECKKYTHKYSGAKFASFSTLEEAAKYMASNTSVRNQQPVKIPSEGYIAYVDGSYDIKTKRYSCGVVILHNSKVIHTISEIGPKSESSSTRNIAGEILGSIRAVQYALEHKFDKLAIVHDYAGLAEWANGNWKTNLPLTKEYAEFIRTSRSRCSIKFYKVKGHSNDKYNDMADQLAKNALGIS